MSRCIGDPDMIRSLASSPSRCFTRLRANNVLAEINLITQLFCPGSRLLQVSLPASQPRSWLLGGSPVESLQSHFILTMSHRSSGLPVCFLSQGTQVQIPRGVLMWNRDSPASDVSLQRTFFPEEAQVVLPEGSFHKFFDTKTDFMK
jgi:hypothetical protein